MLQVLAQTTFIFEKVKNVTSLFNSAWAKRHVKHQTVKKYMYLVTEKYIKQYLNAYIVHLTSTITVIKYLFGR